MFGHPDENIMYLPALAMSLDECGHSFHVVKKTPFQVKKRLLNIILQEKINALANATPPKQMNTVQKLGYVDAWQVANREMLNDVGLGQNCIEGGKETFVTGVFLSTAAAKNSVPLLQTVYQADAAHMNFGKYTLYSCYGITANCNALPVALGIVFGNEDREGWGLFWKFAKSHHPMIDQRTVTIITDQQKGSIEAMKEVLPLAVNFFCSYHRKKNIGIHVKGGKGEFSCHWYYELLLGQSSMGAIELKKAQCESNMQANALKYLANVNEYQQYPAARVEYGRTQGVDVYMYTRSSSSTAEAMNAANFAARARTAVDPVNAVMLLLKLEVERYNKQLQKAWRHTKILTPHGHDLSLKIFAKVNQRDYLIKIEDGPDKYECIVQRYTSVNKNQCWFPKSYDDHGSLFGGCSCGYPFTSGLPCHHMIAVVLSNRIVRLNETNVLPIRWHTSHWRKQLPRESAMWFDIDMSDLRTKCTQQMNYSLCPPYTAPKTTGRPREEKRIKLSVEKAIEKKNKREASNLKRKPVLPMLDDTLYNDKPSKKTRSKKQGQDENQSTNKDLTSNLNDKDDDNILLADLAKKKNHTPNVSLSINASRIDKYNEDIKKNTIGRTGNAQGRHKRGQKVAGIAGDDSEQSQRLTRKSARRAGK